MTFIEGIYRKISDIRYISTDTFSTEWLNQNPSYYRSLKSRKIDASTTSLVRLMSKLGEQAEVLRTGRPNTHLHRVAAQYEAMGEEVGAEIARRSFKQAEGSLWARTTILRIIKSINEQKLASAQDHPRTPYSDPPIIIC